MMRLATLTSVALLLTSACALAEGANTMTSGRPSAVLDDAQCEAVWKMASPDGRPYRRIKPYPSSSTFKWLTSMGMGRSLPMSSRPLAAKAS